MVHQIMNLRVVVYFQSRILSTLDIKVFLVLTRFYSTGGRSYPLILIVPMKNKCKKGETVDFKGT